MASVRFLRRADVDLEDAVAWYEARSPQAARRFEAAVGAAVARIAATPEMYALEDDRHRICPVHKSQYLIVYRYEAVTNEVVVVALVHAKQNPPSWLAGS